MTDVRLLGGRYQLGTMLGYGGMAEVHRGQDLRLGRAVAVKVLRSDLARDPGFQARFRREAQNAAALNHPAIVAVYDTGEDQGADSSLPFIVMEYVEGRTLKEVLATEGRLMPQRALELTADVCAALEFSHRHDIVHRDIKPGNVMLTRAGAVKVMDFGIARAMTGATSTMTQTSAVIGTAQYLSPEQARGATVDARSDVYSTGCLLYELLVGHPPFTGDNPVSVAYQHVREDPVPPSELNPDVTPAIDAIVLKAMAKNPANRYQSAAEMRADLLRAAAGRPVAATPVLPPAERTAILAPGSTRALPAAGGPVPPGTPPARGRRGVTYALLALGIVALLALAGFGTSYLLRNNNPDVTVPDVKGLTQAEATSALEDEGFRVDPRATVSTAEQKGTVLRQNPDAQARAPEGSTIVIEVGAGPEQVTVPNGLVGLSRTGAVNLLTSRELKAAFEYQDSSKPKDTVLDALPGSGEEVAKSSTVTLVLSAGNLTAVPDVRGKAQDEAETTLREAGFTVIVATEITDGKPEGTVIDQNPAQNTEQRPGSAVRIIVAKEPEPTVSPTPDTPTESPTPTPTTSPTRRPQTP